MTNHHQADPTVFGPQFPSTITWGDVGTGKASREELAAARAAQNIPLQTGAGKSTMSFPVGEVSAPGPGPTGWRAAPDCAACGDRGRVITSAIPMREVTPELLHQMAAVFLESYDADELRPQDARVRAGLGAVLEKVLKPCGIDAHCSCKAGRRASELWYADKHGQYHPDQPDPEPDYDDYR